MQRQNQAFLTNQKYFSGYFFQTPTLVDFLFNVFSNVMQFFLVSNYPIIKSWLPGKILKIVVISPTFYRSFKLIYDY